MYSGYAEDAYQIAVELHSQARDLIDDAINNSGDKDALEHNLGVVENL